MLRLRLDTAERWIDLPHGVRVKVRPLTTTVSEAAFADALERIRPIKREAEDAKAAGMPLDPAAPNGANAAWLQGLQWQCLVDALARYGIAEWQGIAGEDGEPLPVTPAACAAFSAHPDLGREFFRLYRTTLDAVDAEGNAFALSADGATAEARNTAADALSVPNGPAAMASDPAAPNAPAI